MKNYLKYWLAAFAIVYLHVGHSQNFVPVKIKDTAVSWLINNIRSFHQFEVQDRAITVIDVGNQTGSANLPETEEVTSNVYIGISETDLEPRQNLFCIKKMYAVSNIRFDKSNPTAPLVIFSYIDITNIDKPVKKEARIKITLDNAVRIN